VGVVLAQIICESDRPFAAGLLFINGKVALHAPILQFMKGWTGDQVKEHADKHGWKIARVKQEPSHEPLRETG